ncbi:MAG: phosphatidate cytidylyltransferase, partial [Pseudomonadota bacterium]
MTDIDRDLLTLFLGTGALLVIATAAGQLMRRMVADGPTVENFNTRVSAWWTMAALGSAALLAGRTGVTVLFAICSLAALREFLTLS